MKAIVQTGYGGPEGFEAREVDGRRSATTAYWYGCVPARSTRVTGG